MKHRIREIERAEKEGLVDGKEEGAENECINMERKKLKDLL